MKRDSDYIESNESENRNVKPKLSSVIAKVTSIAFELKKAANLTRPDAKPLPRDKRLFAGIVNHLGAAKKRLETESDKIDMQSYKQQIVLEKFNEDTRRKTEAKRILLQLSEKKVHISKEKVDLQGKINSIINKGIRFKSIQESLKTFLSTKTSPALLWLPCSHSPETEKLSKLRDIQVTTMIAEREISDKLLTEPLERKLALLSNTEIEILTLEENVRSGIAYTKKVDDNETDANGDLIQYTESGSDIDRTIVHSSQEAETFGVEEIDHDNDDTH